MTRRSDGRFEVQLIVPVGSMLTYRFVRTAPSEAIEATARFEPANYRVAYIPGPSQIEETISAWSDEPLDALRQDPVLEAARAQPEAAPAALPDTAPTPKTFTFKVVYRWQSDVWFTIEMRGDQTLDDLHDAILDAAERELGR